MNTHETGKLNEQLKLLQGDITSLTNRATLLQNTLKLLELEKSSTLYTRWRAEKGENYFASRLNGEVGSWKEINDFVDNGRYSLGNYFKTEEEAEHYLKVRLATQKVIDRIAELNYAEGWEAKWKAYGQEKYSFYYNPSGRSTNPPLNYDSFYRVQNSPASWYGSKGAIKTVIEELTPEIKLMLGVDDE